MSAIPEGVPFLFCKGESSYKYVDVDINDEELYSNGFGDRITIQKIDAIDLMTVKIDFNELDLCANFNLHYCDQPFIVKLHTFSYKNIVHKNIQGQIGQKIKNILRISSASVLAVVFCFFVFSKKISLINRTLLI